MKKYIIQYEARYQPLTWVDGYYSNLQLIPSFTSKKQAFCELNRLIKETVYNKKTRIIERTIVDKEVFQTKD